MFKWLWRLLFGERNDVDDIVVVPPKRPYRGTLNIDEGDINMAMNIEQADSVDTQSIMIDDGRGGMVPASPQQLQAMMYRPDNYDGLGGQRQRPQGPPQGNQQRPMQPRQQFPQGPPPQQPIQQGYQQPPQQSYGDWQQQPVYQQPPQQQFQAPPRKPYPMYELYTVNNEYHLEIDLPGIDESSLTMEYADSTLVVGGKRDRATDKLKRMNSVEITDVQSSISNHLLGTFAFEFPFKKLIDESAIQAEYIAGILHITMPHRVKGDRITIGLKKTLQSK